MRVLVQGLQAFNRSGTGCYTVELIKALMLLDNGPELICLWPKEAGVPAESPKAQWLQHSSGIVHRLYWEQIGGFRIARKCRADGVHFTASVGAVTGVTPTVVTVHDLCYKLHPEWFPRPRILYYNTFIGAGIRHASHIITDSQASADDLKRFYDIPASRIHIIPLGVDDRFRPADEAQCRLVRKQLGLPEFYFLFVGTLEPRKNLPVVLKAWSLLGDSSPDLVIAGRSGWKMDVEKFILEKGYRKERIHCPGHVSPELLPALYSGATAFIWPSLMEGFGLPLLEAMACGAPVVTSNISSMPEVVGDAALTVRPTDVSALAEAMGCLAANEQVRDHMRAAGIKRAALFTWQRTAKMTAGVYNLVRQETT